ncbi:OmpA family protein [Allosphingosinicella sp.]|jgi:outer membrane protein OmpA-like peptidoglycan-associated protein|uniref:OmpA family protein n=1 Tax=Allosphingosinicella sp. TaxID=2823234 RepID=UPI002EF45995
MSVSKRIFAAASAAALLSTAACVTNPETGEREFPTRTVIGAGAGAIGGYLLGEVLGGRRDRTERIIGAGIGAVAGGLVGQYMDRQEQELKRRTEGTGVVVERQGDELVLTMPSGITFAHDRYDVQAQFQPVLDQVAQTLNAYPATMIDVYGHTDSTGSDAYNQTLSERRAQSVSSYLASRGVQQVRIATQGFGESRLLVNPERTEADRQANRRVEIRIVPVQQGG